jgi:nicotinamide phosphoribosyltransferase
LVVIPGARYFYDEPKDQVVINSVNASEHSVSTTKIFTVGEQQMIADWLQIFPKGILSIVSDTFDLWKLITEYLPANKEAIMARDGKLVIRPDSGNPVDIICGREEKLSDPPGEYKTPAEIGVIELLWDIFGGTVNEQGYKVLDPHIGAIYGDSITLDRQIQIYERLAAKGFASTNIVLGVGSFTYQMNTRDSLGFAAKGSWFQTDEGSYDIYKDPITDDGTKKSLRGLVAVHEITATSDETGKTYTKYEVQTGCNAEEEASGILATIYEDGEFYNQTTLEQVRQRIENLV